MQNRKLRQRVISIYIAVTILWIPFLLYLGLHETISVQNFRTQSTAIDIPQVSSRKIVDSTAPIGIRTEYCWTWQKVSSSDSVLAFYLAHHNAEVYLDHTLVYHLASSDTNRISKTPGSSWVCIPLRPSDSGKTVHVVVTPLFQRVRNQALSFHITPLRNLYRTQFLTNLPLLALSSACMIFGGILMLVELVLILKKKIQRLGFFFLGNFLLLLGVWRVTSARFPVLLFPKNSILLSSLAASALCLSSIPLFLHLYGRFSKLKAAQHRWNRHILLLLMLCAMADVLWCRLHNNASGAFFLLAAILIDSLVQFLRSILTISRQACTDLSTGLWNKSRWNTLMDDLTPIKTPISMIMLDLNGLKQVNDTLGHEVGDQILRNFSTILSQAILPPSVICRWGGDEFAVMLVNTDRAATEHCIAEIHTAVAAYNAANTMPTLYFAAGYALSSEFPGLSRRELLEKADARMYQDKQMWHNRRPDAVSPT